MARCAGFKPDGTPCERIVGASQTYCYAHDPDRADERRRAARKGGQRGGRGRPMAEVAEIQGQLSELYASVLAGETEPKVGAVLAQIANVRARIVETGLKAKEQAELEERLEQLEALLDHKDGARRWGG